MITWDEINQLLTIQHIIYKPSDWIDHDLSLIDKSGNKISSLDSLLLGMTLLKTSVLISQTFFGPKVKFFANIDPKWTSQEKFSRFTQRKRKKFERVLVRARIKLIPISTQNKFKIFLTVKEQLRNSKIFPKDYYTVTPTTCKVKLTFVERTEKSKPSSSPMKRHSMAKAIKGSLTSFTKKYPVELQVFLTEREGKSRLVVVGILSDINIEELKSAFHELIVTLESYLSRIP